MPFSCPACGKKTETALASALSCERCGCDLSLLRDTLLAAAALLHLAKATLASGRYDDALAYATRSWSLKRDPLCAEVACLAAAACGQAGTLARWRHCAVRQ